MRKDAVYTVLLNATLFKGMKCSYAPQDQRYLRFSTFDRNGASTHFNLRVSVAFGYQAFSPDRSMLIGVFVYSLPMQGSPVNSWKRSTRISPKWLLDPRLMTISPLYFQSYFSFSLSFLRVLGPSPMCICLSIQKIWMSSRVIRYHVD